MNDRRRLLLVGLLLVLGTPPALAQPKGMPGAYRPGQVDERDLLNQSHRPIFPFNESPEGQLKAFRDRVGLTRERLEAEKEAVAGALKHVEQSLSKDEVEALRRQGVL